MAVINRLMVDRFRNLKEVDLAPSPRFNLLFGTNGSGKTSLLEAIHVLSVGRSFRTHKIDPLVAYDRSDFLIFADMGDDGRVGLLKSRSGNSELKLDGQQQKNWQSVASRFAVQVINSESFSLLEGGAKIRRRFLDWAVFHVEHDFLADWRDYRRCVSHRNSLLKQRVSDLGAQLKAWDIEIARLGEGIHQRRQSLISGYSALLSERVGQFLPGKSIELDYKPGWDTSVDLQSVLSDSRERDIRYGMTLAGPHRADFQVRLDKHLATDVLSRGQLKMLVCAIKLSMGEFITNTYKEDHAYQCVYLLDDLAAELDAANREVVIACLEQTKSQCFFTAVHERDLGSVSELMDRSGKFHVEHGKISA